MTETQQPGRAFLWISVITANLLALTVGLMLAWTSPVIPKLEVPTEEDNPFGRPASPAEVSWIASLLSLGAIFGPFFAAFFSSTVGRKYTLLILAIPYIVAFFTLTFAKTPELYFFARTISGLSCGGAFTILPTYLAEISDDAVRGAVGTSMNIFVTSGLLIAYALGPYISIMIFSLICALVPCVFFLLFMIFMPETPFYLISKGKLSRAEGNLRRLRGGKGDDSEFEQIKSLVKSTEGGSFKDLYQNKANIKALTFTLSLVTFQQLSGINVVLMYTQGIFEATNGIIPAKESPIILGIVQVLASCVTPIFVDRYGRRILLLISAFGMIISESLLGIYFFLDDTSNISWLPVVCICVYIFTYAMGFGCLPWSMMAELLPSNIKDIASAITASFCWFVSFILTKYFGALSDEIGQGGSFLLFAACNVAAAFVTFFFIPETKGKSAKEIEDMLNG